MKEAFSYPWVEHTNLQRIRKLAELVLESNRIERPWGYDTFKMFPLCHFGGGQWFVSAGLATRPNLIRLYVTLYYSEFQGCGYIERHCVVCYLTFAYIGVRILVKMDAFPTSSENKVGKKRSEE